MATRIPLPGNMIDTLMRGVNTGSNMYSGIMNPILNRENQQIKRDAQKQAEEHFKQQMALRQAQFARSGANSDIQRQILEQQLLGLTHKNDPMYKINQFAALQNMLTGGGGTPQGQAAPTQEMGEGMGMFTPEGMESAQSAASQGGESGEDGPINLEALRKNPMLRGFFKSEFGIDPLAPAAQTPEEKLQDKIRLEDYKNQQAIQNKDLEETRKVSTAAKNDIPHLQQTLDSLEKMKKIATNNPDLFGHSGIYGIGADKDAERFAKTTKNPNAGAWQTYGLGPIIAAESKMSSRGNQLALKQALANKPNFSESQNVALSKINANIEQIKKQIKENQKLSGEGLNTSGSRVINGVTYYPDGQGGWEHD